MKTELPAIGPDENFYGYIVALGIGTGDDTGTDAEDAGRHLYAMFEYNGVTQVWLVPDEELFAILSEHLNRMAWIRKNTDEYGYDKLWISKKNGQWKAGLP